ncbi:MAG: hypothetical protein AAF761_09140 [Pseudomonadota bacterium]
MTAMNLDRWNGLSEETRTNHEAEIKASSEEPAWASAQDALVNDIACTTGNGDCPAGDARVITLVNLSEADFDRARSALIAQVPPEWAERAGGQRAARWSAPVSKVFEVTIE